MGIKQVGKGSVRIREISKKKGRKQKGSKTVKKVLIIDASYRNGFCVQVLESTQEWLQNRAEVEVIRLREREIQQCRGCALCLSRGSSFCPSQQDDAQVILDRMTNADGVIFIVPNYALQVPGNLKILLDRLAYVFHRPRLFGRASLPLIVQGVYGGGKIARYINEVMGFWGMNPVAGAVLTGGVYPREALTEEISRKNRQALEGALQRFMASLMDEKPRQPSFFRLMIFRSTRAAMRYSPSVLPPDKAYFQEKGWLEAPYFYPVRLNPLKKAAGSLIDQLIKRLAARDAKAAAPSR